MLNNLKTGILQVSVLILILVSLDALPLKAQSNKKNSNKTNEEYLYPQNVFDISKWKSGKNNHPCADLKDEWIFYCAHEFNPKQAYTDKHSGNLLPKGFIEWKMEEIKRFAIIDNSKSATINEAGELMMYTYQLESPLEATQIAPTYRNPNPFKLYRSAAFASTIPKDKKEVWFPEDLTGKRFEIRARWSTHKGFTNAIWMTEKGTGIPWPDAGEIDILENPRKDTTNNTVHFTLHTENFNMRKNNSFSATYELGNMYEWNIYWVEIHEDEIKGGVNGITYFHHTKGAGDNFDWPYNQGHWRLMLTVSCASVWALGGKNYHPGYDSIPYTHYRGDENYGIQWLGYDLNNQDPPFFSIDWIRIYSKSGDRLPFKRKRFW